ncbi:GNAT family N-acetyltransferase [Frankia sp. QA3]|uniref:GNAT family N-acetyltransferase n=1 Tax=Frankia sp. QA3 TaxID=710111 RepID=UPI000269BB38|nr:GNAT family N-acetyltransferase [Frankia sp. QA3]EIV91218.1 acetyltransferase [Frankia sp. QA3]
MRSVFRPQPANVAFRHATDSDAEAAAIVALVESAYRGESSRAGWTTEADLLGGQRTDADEVRAALAAPHGGVLLAEEPSGLLVGCCHVERLIEPAAHGGPGVVRTGELVTQPGEDEGTIGAGITAAVGAYFGMFAVSPTRQGAGVGGALLRLAERHAVTAWSAAWMEMQVIAQRTELIDWYRRKGYVPTTETRPFPYADERFGRPLRPDLYFVVLRRPLA